MSEPSYHEAIAAAQMVRCAQGEHDGALFQEVGTANTLLLCRVCGAKLAASEQPEAPLSAEMVLRFEEELAQIAKAQNNALAGTYHARLAFSLGLEKKREAIAATERGLAPIIAALVRMRAKP